MRRILVLTSVSLLCACASTPEYMKLPPPESQVAEPSGDNFAPSGSALKEDPLLNVEELSERLGIGGDSATLGFSEKAFDGCQFSNSPAMPAKCGKRFLSTVRFRLLCRDSVETVSVVSSSFTPLVASSLEWRIAGASGKASTNFDGIGHLRLVSTRPIKSERFILILGTKSMGLEAGEVSQIILPRDWCTSAGF